MRRRHVLFGTFAVVAGVPGCLGRQMDIQTVETSSGPGSEWRVSIEAENIAGMYLSSVPQNEESDFEPIEFVTHGARTVSSGVQMEPIPDRVSDTSPAYWFWNSRVSVKAMIPYIVSGDAEPGEYEYEVTVFADDNPDSTSTTEVSTITIQES